MKDPHAILGVEKDATEAQIRAAYRRLARLHHPDRFATAGPGAQRMAQRRMSELNIAYGKIGPRPAPESHAAETAFSYRQRREEAIRQATYQRWEAAEARAKARWHEASVAAATNPTPEPVNPRPRRRDPKEVFAGDGEQLDGPSMMLKRLERLRAQRSATTAADPV